MPSRHRYTTLTKRDIENLKILLSPEGLRILAGIIAGASVFCVGVLTIFSLTNWLHDFFGLSNEFTSFITVFGFVALIVLSLSLTFGTPFILLTKYNRELEKKHQALQIANIDSMTGIEFEHYLQRLLTHRGYRAHVTKASGDLGIDLIASLNSDKFAIQAKRYDTKVSRRAISDAVAGMQHYGCNRAVVITNNYFTSDAVKLAQSTNCILIDRDTLAKWITEYQQTKP